MQNKLVGGSNVQIYYQQLFDAWSMLNAPKGVLVFNERQ